MVDSVRFGIALTQEQVAFLKRSTRSVYVNAGFLQYRIPIGKIDGFKDLCMEVRGRDSQLVVECTAPILLYGNNVAEITNDDVWRFCERIAEIINIKTELEISAEDVLGANVYRIHFGKNIIMSSAGAVVEVLGFAAKTDVPGNRKESFVKFQNGEAFHLHTSKYDIVLYDKVSENLTKKLSSQHPISSTHNLLRFEVRLNGKRTINQFFPTNSYTIESLFREEVSKQVVLKAFGMIFNSNHYGDDAFSVASLEKQCAKTPSEALASIGLNYLLKELGLAATKHMLRSSFGTHVWRRYRSLAIVASTPSSVEHVLAEIQKWDIIPP